MTGTDRAGRARDGNLLSAQSLVQPSTLSRVSPHEGAEEMRGHPQPGGRDYGERLLQARLNFILAKLGKGSQTSYRGSWRQWCLFCRARKRDPYLLGRNAREERDDEEVLLDYITYLGLYMHRTAGTIQSKLMGIRFNHLAEGIKDPLHQKGRIWLTLGGIKRLAKKEQRKWPVTVAMLRWCA